MKKNNQHFSASWLGWQEGDLLRLFALPERPGSTTISTTRTLKPKKGRQDMKGGAFRRWKKRNIEK